MKKDDINNDGIKDIISMVADNIVINAVDNTGKVTLMGSTTDEYSSSIEYIEVGNANNDDFF